MAVLARFNAGKRLNLTQREAFQTRSYLSGLRYNEGFNWHYTAWKEIYNRSPGAVLKKFIAAQTKYSYTSKRKLDFNRNVTKKKQKITRCGARHPNTDYGPFALQADMSPEEIANECERYLEKLKLTPERRMEIAQLTVGQFENPLYRSERSEKLTASNFGMVIKRREYTSCHSLVKAILSPQSFSSEATEYGKLNEAVAVSLLESTLNVKVDQSGLFLDAIYPFLGASPDGLIGEDEIVEVKCLLKVSKLKITLEEAARTIPSLCLEYVNGSLSLKKTHNYYYQVQGQLHITQREICNFVVFVNNKTPLFIQKIKQDKMFWENKMKYKLITFYKSCILPEIIRGNLKRGLRCVDPPYIIAAQHKRLKNKKPQQATDMPNCSTSTQ